LKNVKNSLKGWCHNLRGKYKKRKSDISLSLADLEMREEDSPLPPADIQKRAELQQIDAWYDQIPLKDRFP
jgi:hypothetical protein